MSETARTTNRLEAAVEKGEIDAKIIEPGVPTPTVPDAARALGVSEGQIVKSLLFASQSGEVVLAIVSGASRVNRQRLADVAGVGRLKLADPDTVLRRTGYPAGGTPPVAHATDFLVIIDRSVLELPVVYGGGGRIESLLEIRPAEIVRVTGAKVADIAD